MDKDAPQDKHSDLNERKAKLLRQGEFYRVGIVHAKAQVRQGMRPDQLFHSALEHATWAIRSRIDGLLEPRGMNVSSVMPYAIGIIGFLTRRRLLKPALGVGAALAALAWYLQRRRARPVH